MTPSRPLQSGSAEPVERGARIAVESGDVLGEFEVVATIGARLVVGQHRARRLELVIDLRRRDEIALAGEKPPCAAPGR